MGTISQLFKKYIFQTKKMLTNRTSILIYSLKNLEELQEYIKKVIYLRVDKVTVISILFFFLYI